MPDRPPSAPAIRSHPTSLRGRLAILAGVLLACVLITACSPQARGPDARAVAENNRGVGLMGQFDYTAAHEVFAELARRYPDWEAVQVNLAIATLNRQHEGDDRRALEIAEQVLARDPDNLRAHYVAGLMQLYLGEPEQALRHFEAVTQADPKDAYAAYYLAQILGQLSRYDQALSWYRKAMTLDPYMRSAYYGAFQVLRRLKRKEEARALIRDYQRLDNNPRAHLAEFKYTRMGPKAEALAVDIRPPPPPAPPRGPLFAKRQPLPITGEAPLHWRSPPAGRPLGLAAVDLDTGGRPTLFVASALASGPNPNLILRPDGGAQGGYSVQPEHPLARVAGVNASVWGDYDNDGLIDCYLLRQGPNQLWRQTAAGQWQDVTGTSGTANGGHDSVDGAFFDADHDGDLDLFVVNTDGPNELLNNNRDGSFRPIAQAQGIAGDGRPSRQVLPTDLDGDRDVDIVVIKRTPPHEVYINDRLWAYHPAEGLEAFQAAPALAAIAEDRDADGRVEIYTTEPGGHVLSWAHDEGGALHRRGLGEVDVPPGGWAQMAVSDVNGDGVMELMVSTAKGWWVYGRDQRLLAVPAAGGPLAGAIPVLDRPTRGPSVVALAPDRGLEMWPAGTGRYPFLALSLSGREDTGESMRSNASGIGAMVSVRMDSRWTVTQTYRRVSGPGQGHQPLAIGLGGHPQADFVAIDWSDGVYQSELALAAGQAYQIPETQRQLSSCPVLFAWNGTRFEFVSDLLGVGGIGFALGPGEYTTPRPWENFLLPADLLRPLEGDYTLKLTEPMEETTYLDATRLVAYDLPPGWDMVLDERMGTSAPEPTGQVRFYREQRLPVRVSDERGQEVTDAVRERDGRAAPVGARDHRFLGRLEDEHVLTLEFGTPLDAAHGHPILVADGWVEYPYSQTMFAAWQAGARYRPPSLDYLDGAGRWQPLLEDFGYPAGMPRRMSVPLDGLPPGTHTLRLRTNMEIYWDRLAVAFTRPLPQARRIELPLREAQLKKPGYPLRQTLDQRRPSYDYRRRSPFWDTRYMAGLYTRLGPVGELVEAVDDAVAIIGAGEEVELRFEDRLAEPPPGWHRRFVLETHGWAKDMDLYTRDGETVAPLPSRGPADPARVRQLHERYNTRYQAGL